MKNKKLMCSLLACAVLLTTGCGNNNYIQDKDKKIVTDPTTGQSLQKEIYCRPSEDTEVYKLYQEYEDQMTTKLSELPECENFKIGSTKTNSLWQLIFVKPLSYIILKLGNVFESWGMTKAYLGLSLMVIGLLIRLILLPFNIKTQKQSQNMQKVQPEIMKLEKKYQGRTDTESQMMKSQEMSAIYKKYNVNPLSSCLLALIQLPIFFAFLQAIYKIPTIYEGEIFGWNLGTTPSVGIFTNHQYSFIILLVLIIATTFFSFKYTMSNNPTSTTQPGAGNQMKTMLYFMTIFIAFASFSLPTAIALYWIVSYAFVIAQTYIMNLLKKKKEEKEIYEHKNGRVEKKEPKVQKEVKEMTTTKKTTKTSSNSKKTTKKEISDKMKMKEGMKYGKNK